MLRKLRCSRKMTQAELGGLTGYCTASIARLESSARRPDVDVVKTQFVKALGLEHTPDLAQKLIALARASRAYPHS
ncbi:MAG: helix-turn-helix domain-containing protein [Anaerolineae bacterium]|nr:helix-turn-helix domain-containing protein [Anaerolineae bacterium]